MAEWLIKKTAFNVDEISRNLNIDKCITKILLNRGVSSYEDARAFLNPELTLLPSPFLITGVKEAVECVLKHVESNSKIAVYSDYDVDGVMSSVILQKCLEALGANFTFYVPDREREGYGLNKKSVKLLRDRGVSLIIACDNGISSLEEAEFIYENEMRLVVIDHHEPASNECGDDVLPLAEAIINPKMKLCGYPFKAMCAAGLCYRFACALLEKAEPKQPLSDGFYDDLLVFAGLATVCDIVDLLGDNRIIVRNALLKIENSYNYGINSLMRQYELQNCSSFHFGFILGPAINAAGRLESAKAAISLFMARSEEEASKLAKYLYELNKKRRAVTESAVTQLNAQISAELAENNDLSKVCVLYDENVHESVAGIVAGKLKEAFWRPVVIITQGKGCAKGSARSIEGYNIYDALTEVSHLFVKFGGHSQAAGFSIKYENINALRTLLNENCSLTEKDFVKKIHIDDRLAPENVSFALYNVLEKLSPFGKANREPVFAEKNVCFKRICFLGKDEKTIKLFPKNNPAICAMIFDNYNKFVELMKSKYDICDKTELLSFAELELDIVYTISKNEYRGECKLQLVIKDFR